MHFTIDRTAFLLVCLAIPIAWFIYKSLTNRISPSLAYSRADSLPSTSSFKASLPTILYLAAAACFLLAFLDPHFVSTIDSISATQSAKRIGIPTEGIAIYLVLDQSGSMAQKVMTRSPSGSREYIPKIDLLKSVTEQFILNRPDDLMGLITFARVPKVLAPLTLDQQTLIDQLHKLQIVKGRDEDGTAMGYAIFKAANLISATRHYAEELNSQSESPYAIKSAIIVVVTDGLQDPNQLDKGNRLRTMELDDAANYAKNQNVKVYIVNIDPSFSTEQFAPHRRQMQTITQLTGGQFYLVDDEHDLKQIYANINALEKGKISQPDRQTFDLRGFSFYPYLIALGLICFLCACLIESLVLRTFP